jgi:hypothetical protein
VDLEMKRCSTIYKSNKKEPLSYVGINSGLRRRGFTTEKLEIQDI